VDAYDLVIVGGGLVGGSLACALGQTGLHICVVEAVALDAAYQPGYDERVIALSWGSRRILEGIGLWSEVAPEAAPIHRIHVSDRGHFGFTRLDCRQEGVEALGYVVPARLLGRAIRKGLTGVDLLCPARLVGLRVDSRWASLDIATEGGTRVVRGRLLVAADGGDSGVRKHLGLVVRQRRYGHDAVITTVAADRPQPGVAFERFTDTGPLAMLPMTGGRYSVVWTVREGKSAEILGLPDSELLDRLQARFGYRLGRFSPAGRRAAYPLKLLLTKETVRPRVVLIGNAAHTLHPVAGQGLNLGLRDVAAAADVLADARRERRDPGQSEVLEGYRRLRGRDQAGMAAITDTLARLFVNPWPPVRVARDLGMLGLDLAPGFRHVVARHLMGLDASQPRLARGLPLVAGHDR
jgi:2-octaprenyl-6-methoxyphenol hydroxylase